MNYRLIAADLDGTILNNEGLLSDYTRKTVKEYQRLGGMFTIATGRMDESARRFADELEVQIPVVTYNGGKVVELESGRTLSEAFLDNDAAIKTYNALREINKDMVVYFNGLPFAAEINDVILKYKKRIKFDINLICDVEEVITPYTKKILVIDPKREFDLMESITAEIFGDRVNCVISDKEYFEILPTGVSKGGGLKTIADSLNIPLSEVMAIGDHINDISMIKAAGLGVAVQNAEPQVIAAADYVTLSNEEDGVAYMIKKVINNNI